MTDAVERWIANQLPPSHYLDNRIYVDDEIFSTLTTRSSRWNASRSSPKLGNSFAARASFPKLVIFAWLRLPVSNSSSYVALTISCEHSLTFAPIAVRG